MQLTNSTIEAELCRLESHRQGTKLPIRRLLSKTTSDASQNMEI